MFLFSSYCGFTQNRAIDSVLNIIKTEQQDTNKFYHLLVLCDKYIKIGSFEKGLSFANEALELAQKLGFKKGIGNAYLNIGTIYLHEGKYSKSLEKYLIALKLFQEINLAKGMAASYVSIGRAYEGQGDYPKALENYLKSNKMYEAIGNKNGMSMCLMNIGNIYFTQKNYTKALVNQLASLKIKEELDDKNGISNSFNNIGNIYFTQKNYAKAFESYMASLKISEELGNQYNIAMAYGNMGSTFFVQGNNDKALEYYMASLKINEVIGDKLGIVIAHNNIGNILLSLHNIPDAKKRQLLALDIAIEIGAKDQIMSAYNGLAACDSAAGNFKGAYRYYKLHKQYSDSLYSEESGQKTSQMSAQYESEKKDNEIKLLNKDKETQAAITEVESNKQKVVIWSVAVGLFLVLIFSLFMFNRWRITKQQNLIIEKQKEIVEEKHKEITDSINYAERIQRALLASKKMLDENLNNYFILFKPKDVVSGDFYWATLLRSPSGKVGQGLFTIVTADSTGHGVPGAIMSIVNIASLKEAVVQGIASPDLILNETRRLIIEKLKNDGSTEGGKDGMDGSILSFDFTNNILYCACANNPIWIIRKNELIEIKSDRMPIGKHDKDKIPFTLHSINLVKGDVIYTLTDGFPDQFGGINGKKFKSKQLQEILLTVSQESMEIQKQKLSAAFDNWRGDLEQVDDVCIVGIRV